MDDEVTISARRDIQRGEELTIDYATFVIDDAYVMPGECKCGAAACRHKITGNDWQQSDLQQGYKDHFSPYLNKRIKMLSKRSHMKKSLICVVALLVIVVAALAFFYIPDDDCARAFQKLSEQVDLESEETGGDADGIGVKWSLFGCTLSGDTKSWFVTPWGSVKEYTKE